MYKSFTTLKHILLLSKQPTILLDGITPVLNLIDRIFNLMKNQNPDQLNNQLTKHFFDQFYMMSKVQKTSNKLLRQFKIDLISFINYFQIRTKKECQLKKANKSQNFKKLCKMVKTAQSTQQLAKELKPVFKLINQTICLFQRVNKNVVCITID